MQEFYKKNIKIKVWIPGSVDELLYELWQSNIKRKNEKVIWIELLSFWRIVQSPYVEILDSWKTEAYILFYSKCIRFTGTMNCVYHISHHLYFNRNYF